MTESAVVEVSRCGECPMRVKIEAFDYQYCAYPGKQQSCTMAVDMFATCPLKQNSITIKLKNDGTND